MAHGDDIYGFSPADHAFPTPPGNPRENTDNRFSMLGAGNQIGQAVKLISGSRTSMGVIRALGPDKYAQPIGVQLVGPAPGSPYAAKAIVSWGVGGLTATAMLDCILGCSFVVVASSITVKLVDAAGDNSGLAYDVGAFLCMGPQTKTIPPQLTVNGEVDAEEIPATGDLVVEIPSCAQIVTVSRSFGVPAGGDSPPDGYAPAFGVQLLRDNPAPPVPPTSVLGNYVIPAGGDCPAIGIPGQARYIRLINNDSTYDGTPLIPRLLFYLGMT